MTALHRLTSPFAEFGAFGGLVYLLDRSFSRFSSSMRLHYYELMVQPVTDKPLVPDRLLRNVEFREIRQGDPDIELMPARADIKQMRFEIGAVCLGMYAKRQLLGFIWMSFDRYPEDEVRCDFDLYPKQASVFDFDVYIFPEHRLGLSFVQLWEGANRLMRSRGIHYTYSRVSRFNLDSRRAHKHLGGVRLGSALFLQLGRFEFMTASVTPYLHVSVARGNRVRLAMTPDALGSAPGTS